MVLARFLQSLDEKNVIDSIQSTFKKYGNLTASELVTITHRKGTPWDHTNINDIITDGADPKVLNLKKVYMITHRRSGLLISKFAL